jgi:cytoskeleton protein RodZ
MIERASEFGASQGAPLAVGDSTHMSAGDMLREAREAHGLHIEVVAAALKVPAKKLQALEDDDIDSLPDPAFARALAASVARALKIDAAQVLAKMPGSPRAALAAADRTISTSFRSGAPRSGRGSNWLPSRALLVVVTLLLIGAAALFWLPQSTFDQLSAAVARITSRSTAETASESESAPVSATAPGTVVEPAMPAATQPATNAPGGSSGVQDGAVGSAPLTAAAVAPGGDILVFVARADSWVTVTEAGGKQLLRRTVQAGETVGLTGSLPLTVVVGRASGIDVQVRGKAFDLGPVTKGGGVARFEVKS